MAATIEKLGAYLGLLPDEDTAIAQMALDAAIAKATGAGIPAFKNNPHYDLFIYSLAALWYDNRGLTTPGTATIGGAESIEHLVNSFVLELRYAKDGEASDTDG